MNRNDTWAYGPASNSSPALEGTPTPFGKSRDSRVALDWWHNFFSFVLDNGGTAMQGGNIWVHDTEGRALPYIGADAGTYWAGNSTVFPGNRSLLKYDTTTGAPRYTLVHENGLVYEYDASWTGLQPGTKYFLTKVKTPAGETVATVNYALPAPGGVTCPNCCEGCDAGSGTVPSCSSGAPYLDSIVAANGSKFVFVYKYAGSECVVDRVQIQVGTNVADAVIYEYLNNQPGALSKATTRVAGDAGIVEQYGYFDAGMQVTTPAGSAVFVYDDEGRVVSMTGPHEQYTYAWGAADGGVLITNSSMSDRLSGVQVQHAVDITASNPVEAEFHRDTETGGALVCEQGTENHVWEELTTQGMSIPYDKAVQDKRSNYSVATRTAGSLSGFGQLTELTSLKLGASDSTGTNAKETTSFTYSYDSATKLQRVATKTRPSAINGEQIATTITYGTGEEVASEVTAGYTKQISTAGVVNSAQVNWGTVYVRHPTTNTGYCENDTSSTWVLQTNGPCVVSGGACTGDYPITQQIYSTTTGQLIREKKFPGGCDYGAITSAYTEYDGYGNVLREVATNGSIIVSTYDGPNHKVLTRTTGYGSSEAATTSYGYENGEQVWQLNPLGDYEVSCHRSGTTNACSGGTWSGQVQWRAKSASSTGTPFSEKVVYAYWADGSLQSESYYSCPAPASGCTSANQELRRIKKYKPDADKRPTWEGMGTLSTPPVLTKRRYDAASNMTAIGLPLNGAPDYCDDSGSISKTCSALSYDSANRLESVVEYPTSSATTPIKTCYQYDAHGNVNKVVAGCATTNDCSSLPTSCTALAIDYLYDDFGNLVQVTMPDTGTTARGVVTYQYDPAGNLLKKMSPVGAAATTKWWYEYTYDRMGRKTGAYLKTAAAGSTTLFTWVYDEEKVIDCLPESKAKGKLSHWVDGYGTHYLGYDLSGRVTMEIHTRWDATCTVDSNDKPVRNENVSVTEYAYDLNGNLTQVTYPNGRPVVYSYYTTAGARNRVSSIGVKTWTGSDWSSSPTTVISSIIWEPYAGVRKYQIYAPLASSGSEYASVEYLLSSTMSEPSLACTKPTDSSDGTGRLRGLWVSRGALNGSLTGDLLQRVYSWTADQVTTEDICLLGSTTPRRLQYQDAAGAAGYDQLLRFKNGKRPSGNFAATGGPFSSQSYSYDGRGNRTAEVHDGNLTYTGQDYGFTYASSLWLKDQLLSHYDTLSTMKHDYAYNADGQVYQKTTQVDSTGNPGSTWIFSYGPNAAYDPDTTVFKAVGVNGTYYNYFYDAFGRRRLKQYPQSTPRDEYFYNFGNNQMLEDRGFYTTSTVSPYPMDEYLWLDGKPVAYIRTQHTVSGNVWSRNTEWASSTCSRNGDGVPCGIYFLVPDYLGKPVLAINSYRQVVGSAEYDPFGYPNRAALRGETSHPYSNNQTVTLSSFTQLPLGANSQVRVKYHYLDIEFKFDSVRLKNSSGTSLMASGAPHLGSVWSGWATTPSDGVVNVVFSSNSSVVYSGAILEAYEYRRWENVSGLTWAWTPLRFPGQYYDSETDLFENWNRYYDPSVGRYLQPEPLLQVRPVEYWMSYRNLSRIPDVYSYVNNAPLAFVDPTGLQSKPCLSVEWAAKASNVGSMGGMGQRCTCYLRKVESSTREGCWSFEKDTTICQELATKGCEKYCEDEFNARAGKPGSGYGPGGPWGTDYSGECPSGLTWKKGNIKCP